MKIGAIIVCAGRGRRLGAQDKATLRLAQRPLFYHALNTFYGIKEIGEIIVVLHPKNERAAQKIITSTLAGRQRIRIVKGGFRRSDSVRNGLRALDDTVDYVLIHDGARPFVSRKLIQRMIRALRRHPAVICGVEVRDTLKEVRGSGFIKGTLNRDAIVAVQTPQGFKKELLIEAHKKSRAKKSFDDAQLVEALGVTVKVIAGERGNFKITYPEDVIMAKAMMSRKTS